MASIAFKNFKGSVPRVADHLVQAPQAAVAIDCRLWHGDLSSWREPKKTDDLPQEDGYKYELFGCCWVKLPVCASVAPGNVSCTRYFVTGRSEYPEEALVNPDTCEVTWYRLGLPCPYNPPSVFGGTSCDTLDKDAESRTYVYQYVNSRGQRSAASAASDPILINEGDSAVVSGWEIPDASWDVQKVRIYRSVSGMESGREAGNLYDTTLMYVGEAGINDTNFTDTRLAYDLMDAIEEDIVLPPNADMKGVVAITGQNTLAGFAGNKLYFSANNDFYNWPVEMTLDDNICALVESGGLVYVITDGHPYVVEGAADCKTAECRKIVRHSAPYPMIGCGQRRVAETPSGAVYPSKDGLVILAGNHPPVYITAGLYAPDDWQKLLPESIVPVYHQGYLYVFGKRGSFVMQINKEQSTGWDLDTHSWLSDRDVYYGFVSRNGNFYIQKPDGIYIWNAGSQKRPHYWKSGEAVTGVPINFGAVKLYMQNGAETVKIKSDDRYIFDREVYVANQPMTLPMWGTGQRYYFELTGTADVKLLSVATSVKELSA